MKEMLTKLLKSFACWVVQQPWFQKAIAKKLIQVITNSKNETDNKIYEFLFRNKRDLLAMAKREAKLTTTEIDDEIVTALQTLLDPTGQINEVKDIVVNDAKLVADAVTNLVK